MSFLRRFIPTREQVQAQRKYRLIRSVANKPYLWHFRRHACARGFAIGAFWSMWPVAGQFIPCILITAKVRGNVAVAFAALWLSNPFVIIPHWWSAYLLGRLILRTPPADIPITFEYLWPRISSFGRFYLFISENFRNFYVPVFVGSLIEGAVLAALGYVLINAIWRARIVSRWRASRGRARERSAAAAGAGG
jgi:uncharacterized protein (DUF2062 family)